MRQNVNKCTARCFGFISGIHTVLRIDFQMCIFIVFDNFTIRKHM